MADRIQGALGVEPELVCGGGGVFDVHVDGELAFSKFRSGDFPDEAALTRDLQQR